MSAYKITFTEKYKSRLLDYPWMDSYNVPIGLKIQSASV